MLSKKQSKRNEIQSQYIQSTDTDKATGFALKAGEIFIKILPKLAKNALNSV